MDNLTHHQHKMLDKLYGPLEKKDPSIELIRLSKLYRLHGEYQEAGYIKERFQVSINSQLHRYLQSKSQFYNTALTADEVKELYSGASVPFKYKGANQTSLNSATLIANSSYGMTTTSGASSTGITAGSKPVPGTVVK